MLKIVLFFVFLSASSILQAFTVVIVPQFSPAVIEQTWTPILQALEAKTGHPLKLKQCKTIAEFESILKNGEADFAYMNPYYITKFKSKYTPIVRDDKHKLSGILVVRADSPYKSIKELNGKKIAFPSQNAFAASMLLRSDLRNIEKIDFEPIFMTNATHSNVYKAVVAGDVEAGGGVNRTLRKEPTETISKLKIIHTTIQTKPHPFCANKKLSPKIVKEIKNAFVNLDQESDNIPKLEAIEMSLPVEANYKNDYANIEKMKLKYCLPDEAQ